MQELVEVPVAGGGEDLVLQRIDALLDLLEEWEVRIDELVDDGVEQEVDSTSQQATIPWQSRVDIVDRRHRLVNREDKVSAEKCCDLVGLRGVLRDVDVD